MKIKYAGVHGIVLDLATRLDIAIDVAHAVTYLHMYTGSNLPFICIFCSFILHTFVIFKILVKNSKNHLEFIFHFLLFGSLRKLYEI
jgi:hypothetical protein